VHSIAFARFVRTRGYLRLNDPDLTALFTRKRRFDMLTGIAFVAAVGVVVFMQRAPK